MFKKDFFIPQYTVYENVMHVDEIDAINFYAKTSVPPEDARVGVDEAEGSVSPDIRKSTVRWLLPDQNMKGMFKRLFNITEYCNRQYYKFDLKGFESVQHTTYTDQEEKYDYHVDYAAGVTSDIYMRKLSFVVMLNDPTEYEGGELCFTAGRNHEEVLKLSKGAIICFPSWMMHKVNPVTGGERNSLVWWCLGPKFV